MKKQMKLFTLLTKPLVLFVLLFALGVGNVWGTARKFKTGERIYFEDAAVINDVCMKYSGNNLWAVFVGAGGNSNWIAASKQSGSWDAAGAIYYFDVPQFNSANYEFTSVIFTRNDWGIQTYNESPDEYYNYFKLTTYDSNKHVSGEWKKYSVNPMLIGSMNDWNPDASGYTFGDYDGSVCRLIVDLPADETYDFQILHGTGWYSYDNNKSGWTITNTTHESWQTLYAGNENAHITTGEAGTYIFRYNDSDHTFAAYYPQTRLAKQTILYFDVADNTSWNNKTYTSKWYFKYWDSGSDIDADHPEVCNTPVENYKYYVTIPDNDWLGRVQVDRYDGSRQGSSDVAMAYNRSASTQNCIKIGSGTSTSVTWDTYCPPTTSETFADNSTTKISWQPNTNDGSTSGKAIWVKTNTTLKVQASASKAVADDNMTIKYDFDVNSGATSTNTTGSYTATASTNNTQYAVNAKMYTNYNLDNTASSTKHTHTIYYKALNTYSVTHTLSGVTKASGRSGDDAAAYHVAYDATYTANAGYYLPSDITVTIGGATKTKGTDYTWTVTDGTSGALSILANKIDGNVVVTINGIYRWSIAGSWKIITPGEGDPYWDADTYAMGTITQVSSDYVCSVTVTLDANTNYTFKIVDRAASPYEYWGNNTITYYINYSTDMSSGWTFGNNSSNTAACGLTAAGAGTYTFTWNITQSKLKVTFPTSYYVTAAGNPAAGGTVTPSSATYMSTSVGGEITATPNYSHYFNGWTSNAGGTFTDNTAATTTFKPASADATVTAAFPERTAFIEGNFQIYNSTRATRTKTGDSWQDASTAIKMTYDAGNNRYYLHTYSTPTELREQLNNAGAFFYVKTSTSSSSIADAATYKAYNSAAQSLSEYGSSHSLLVTTGESEHGFKFTGSEDGYVIIYFNGTSVWYELECALSYYGGDGATGDAPAARTYYAYGSNQTAAANTYSKTGYSFDHWDTAADDSGSDYAAGATNVAMNAHEVCLHAQWTAKEYTINLANMEADEGYEGTTSVTVTFDASTNMTASDVITKPTKTHYDFAGYWTSENTGKTLDHMLIGADGKWIKDVEGYTSHDGSGNPTWVHDYAISLYAKWMEHEYAVTLAVSPAGAGTTSPASSTTAKYVTASGDITATPSPGYLFREWGFSETGTGNYDVYVSDGSSYRSTDATIRIKAQRDGTLTANFTPRTYTVRFENLGADKGHKGSLDTTVTFNDTIHMKGRIEVPSKAHYEFGGYYISTDKGATLTDIQIIDANGNWNKGVSGYTGTKDGVASWVCAGDTVLYAKWTETAYTITPSVSPAGAGSVNTVTDAHLVTPSSTITATPVNAAWVFDRWEYGEHVGCASGCSTNSVTVTSDMNSTITAHFKPRYELVGCIWDNSGNGGMPGWNYDGTGEFTVNSFTALGTGEGTGVDLSYSCTLWANTTYKFEVHDRVTGNHGKYYAAGQYLNDGEHALLNQKNNDVPLAAIGAGTYTFRITNMTYDGITDDYFPTITVERPHQMHMGHKRVDIDGTSHSDDTGGTLTASTGGNSLANGDWYNYGANITYTASAQSGYTLTWYTNDSYTSEFPQQPAATWPHDNVTGDENVYAKFTEKSTAVTFSATNGKVQIASTDKANATVGITTSREITAVPNTGYSFSSWTVPGDADFSVESTSSATTTLSGLGAGTAGTLTANFTENMHAVTVKAGSGGSVSSDPALSDGKVTIGITTSATLTATPANAAWVFKNWTGDIDDGITIASGSATSATITINATADSKSITANFEPRYGLHGSLANDTPGGMPGWTGDGADFAVGSFSGIGEGDGKGVDLQCACTLEPNKEYKFRIYDRAADGRWGYSSSVTLGAGESLELSTYGDVSGKDVTIYTVGYGTYTFKITNMYDNGDGKYYPKVTVDRPTSYQFNMGCTEGGTVTAATTAGSGYAITNGQYVAAGDDIQFHAVPAAGYAFDHWYTASDYATSFNDNKDMKMNNISETVNAYAKFVPVTVTYNDGSGDGKWSTASNWSPACVPTIDHDVVITKPVTVDIAHAVANRIVLDQNSHTGKLTVQANKGLEVAGTITRTTDGSNRLATREEDLVLESSSAGNASLIFNNSNACQATVMMYSKATIVGNTWNWQYVGTPFIGSIPQYNYYGSWMYKWNGGWEVVHGGDELTPFAGYCLTQNSATTHVMGGTLVPTTSKSVTMAASTDMVLANSWTAPISIASFDIEGGDATFTSTPATVYLFNTGMAEDGSEEGTEAGTYISVPINSAPYTGNGLIAPMQGFFVTTYNGAAGSITMNYDALVRPAGSHTDIVAGPMYAKKQEIKPEVMKIRANGTQYSDRVVILAREDFSEGFDNGWDGEKLSFGAEAPSVYVINEQGGYDAVSAIPGFEGTLVGFRAGTNNSCTMTFEYDGEEIWYLNDLQTQQSTLIDSELTYTFSTSSYDNEARFIISATPIRKITTGNESVGAEAAKVRKLIINDKLYIIRGGRMYSADGAMIK